MDDLLTVRQLQQMLRVDRITIYRMLEDGRLSGFKVGSQWRFSRRQIDEWIERQQGGLIQGAEPQPEKPASAPSNGEELPLSCFEAVQSLFAEALDVGAVTADLYGQALTEVSNSCAFCQLILDTPEGHRRCALAWQAASRGDVIPCHAGLYCAGAPIEMDDKPIGIAVACQFARGSDGDWQPDLPALAGELGLDERELRAAAGAVHALSEAEMARVERLLTRLAGTMCEMGQERLALVSRLRRIAEITVL